MFGKWSEPSVPHKGWEFQEIEDLGSPSEICEMCEKQEIRYAHHLAHPDYPTTLKVGCVCAEKMEGDYVAPRIRDRKIKNIAQRRKKWLSRKWLKSAAGNSYLRTDGFNITIYQMPNGVWGGCITDIETGREVKARLAYINEDEAKLGAFEGLVFLCEKVGERN